MKQGRKLSVYPVGMIMTAQVMGLDSAKKISQFMRGLMPTYFSRYLIIPPGADHWSDPNLPLSPVPSTHLTPSDIASPTPKTGRSPRG